MSGRPDISQYGRTDYSVVYVAVNRCAIIIQIMCYAVKGVKISHYIQNFKRQNSTSAENNSLSVRTFDDEKSTVQKSVPTWHELYLKKILSKLDRSEVSDIRPTCREVDFENSAQVGQNFFEK